MDVEARLEIGAVVHIDGGDEIGRVGGIVTTPTLSRVTHLVIDGDGTGGRRLLPISELVDRGGSLAIRDGRGWPDAYPLAEKIELLEPDRRLFEDSTMPYAPGDVWFTPELDLPIGPRAVALQMLPPGEVAVQAGSPVVATDGPIGHVAAVLIDPETDSVTHVLLRHGHFWGRRTVALPIGLVESVDGADGAVTVGLSREDVADYAID